MLNLNCSINVDHKHIVSILDSFRVMTRHNGRLRGSTPGYLWFILFLQFGCMTPAAAGSSSTSLVPTLTPIQDFQDFIPFGMDPFQFDKPSEISKGSTRILFAGAVAARGNDIFVADTVQKLIFRIDRAQRTITTFKALSSGQPTALYLASDLSLYVVDRVQNQVLRYTRDGHLVTTFRDSFTLANPVDVMETAGTGRVLIADQLGAKIIEYNRAGAINRTIGQNINRPSPASSIIAMTASRDNIYLLDNVAREVRVTTADGELLYSAGSPSLKQPVALAVDNCQRLYVADQFNNAIHVFYDEDPLTVYENTHPGLSGFLQITDLWIDNDFLYVADGPTGKIKVLLIEGNCR